MLFVVFLFSIMVILFNIFPCHSSLMLLLVVVVDGCAHRIAPTHVDSGWIIFCVDETLLKWLERLGSAMLNLVGLNLVELRRARVGLV